MNRQSGFTFIELLISVTLGAIIISGGLSILFATKKNATYQRAITGLQENGRIAEGIFTRSIRMADFCLNPSKNSGCFNLLANDAIEGIEGGKDNPDSLIIRFESTGSEVDCLGQKKSAGTMIKNTFFVQARDAQNNPITYDFDDTYQYDLMCKGSNGDSAVIVDGIENIQLLYGVDTGSDFMANQYIPANLVTNWKNVVSVSLSFVVQHPVAIKDSVVSQEFELLGTKMTFNDKRLRHQYDLRVQLRNRVIN